MLLLNMINFISNVIISISYYLIASQLAIVFLLLAKVRLLSSNSGNITEKSFLYLITNVQFLFSIFIFCCGFTHTIQACGEYFGESNTIHILKSSFLCLCAIISFISAIVGTNYFPLLINLMKKIKLAEGGTIRLANIIETCHESIVILSSDYLILKGNSATEILFGNLFHGRNILDFMWNFDDETGLREALNQASNAEFMSDPVVFEYRVKISEEEYQWLESSFRKCKSDSMKENDFEIIMITRNIDEKKKTNMLRLMLEESNRHEQERVNKAKLLYITCVAHDLKTPLQSFCFALELLNSTILTAEQKEILDQAVVAVELMKLTIYQSIHVGKTLSGYVSVPRQMSVSLFRLISRVQVIMNGYGSLVPIFYRISDRVHDLIITDEEWLWQMLLNLLTNACKYTSEGSITLTVDESQNDLMLLFQVIDSGIGIAEDKIPTIFEAFSQSQVGQMSGTGLGLFGLRKRVEALGGSYGVKNNGYRPGCTFWFEIPYIKDISGGFRGLENQLPLDHKNNGDSCKVETRRNSAVDIAIGDTNSNHYVHTSSSRSTALTIDNSNKDYDEFTFLEYGRAVCAKKSTPVNSPKSLEPPAASRFQRYPSPRFDSIRGEETPRYSSPPNSMSCQSSTKTTTTYSTKYHMTSAIIIDDSLSIRKLLHMALKNLGYVSIDSYQNGAEGLKALKIKEVDIVFSDVQMPVMTGPEMAIRFRQFEDEALATGARTTRQKIICITANRSEELVMMVPNVFDYICSKPVDLNELERIVKTFSGAESVV